MVDKKLNYHIIVNLPVNRDFKGTLKVYNGNGDLVYHPVPVLGRGSNDALNNYNHANQLMRNADTPTGVAKTRIIPEGLSPSTYGRSKRVHLYQGISGNFLEAEKRGRSEILIHGGETTPPKGLAWYPLRPTYGCLRLSEIDMKNLIIVLKDLGSEGKITINNI